MIAAIWTALGSIGGILRMSAAAGLIFLLGLAYVTLWTIPAAKEEGRHGYVLEATATAATARADELQRQIDVQRPLLDAYSAGFNDLLQKQAAQDAETEKAIALNENARRLDGRSCPLTNDDLEFLRK